MEAKPIPVRVSPITGGGISIYLPKELVDIATNLLPHSDRNDVLLDSYHVVAKYDDGTTSMNLERL